MEPHKLTPKLTIFGGKHESSGAAKTTGKPPLHDSGNGEMQSPKHNHPLMPVAVRDLVPLLVDAFQTDRTWLKDFGREEIHVSADLYEILLAYQQYRRYDAA